MRTVGECLFSALGPTLAWRLPSLLGTAYLSEEFREGLPFAMGAGGSPPLPGKAVIPWPPTEQPKVLGKGLCSELGSGVGHSLTG